MNMYLICNNMLSNNINFINEMSIEEKKMLRPLSSEGLSLSRKIILENINKIYSSEDIASIETANIIGEKNLLNVNLVNNLFDCKVGNLKKQSLKMLSYFQEHDFNYKLESGESLNECSVRVENEIKKILKFDENIVVVLPRRALFSYLLKLTTNDFNLDERLVLTNDDDVIMESFNDSIEIFKVTITEEETNIEKICLEEESYDM